MITLCLVMIVKDESSVIRRCLSSVVEYLDSYCICDTGSTDNTPQIIEKFFKDYHNEHPERKITGQILHHEWKNFGHNRTLAVQAAKGMADYLLLMDADFVFKCKDPKFKTKDWTEGSYLIKYEGYLDYCQPLMVRGDLDWRYIGVTHEYIHCPLSTRGNCQDFTFLHVGDGANKGDKFTRDIALLEQGIKDEPTNMRYYFYLGQSNKDLAGLLKLKSENLKKEIENGLRSGQLKNKSKVAKFQELGNLQAEYKKRFQAAIDAYNTRIKKEDFPEEVYYAKYMLGHCHYHLGSETPIWVGHFLEAYNYRPKRLEALYQLIKHYRLEKKYQLVYDLGARPARQPYPHGDCLFIDSRIHRYLLKHEIALAAYYLGDLEESLRLVNEILKIGNTILPQHRMVIEKHQKTCQEKIKQQREVVESGKPRVAFFTYNELHTGGAEKSFSTLMGYLEKTGQYTTKYIRDYREISHFKPNLLVCQQFAIQKGVQVAEDLGIPVAVTQHGPNQWHYAKRSSYFLFNSEYVANTEVARTGIPHYDIVWPYVPVEDYPKVELSKRLENGGYISFVGRATQAKGVKVFLELARERRDLKFLLAGGPIPEQYNELAASLDNLTVVDFTQSVMDIYSKTRVLIFPSLYESFGRVAVEASMCGIPVITSDLPGIREATSNLAVYVQDPHQVTEWSEALTQVLAEEPQRVTIADEISRLYQEKSLEQLWKFSVNVRHLVNRQNPCKYTRHLRFSVTISVYNRPKLVMRAIESVLAQTYTDWEIVIVDDASNDETTWSTLTNYLDNLDEELSPKIRLLRNETNLGTYESRNRAIQAARGDYLVNLDSDDCLVPEALDLLRNEIWKNNSKIIQYKFYRDLEGELLETTRSDDKAEWQLLAHREDLVNHKQASWGHFCIEREYLVKRVGFYDSVRFGADTEMMCRLRNFHRNTNLSKILYYASAGSLTENVNPDWPQEYIKNFMAWHKDCRGAAKIEYPMTERPFPLPEIELYTNN